MAGQATWQSQNTSVLSIDDSGLATGNRPGESVITVRVASISSATEVVVVPPNTYRLAIIVREGGSTSLGVRVDVIQGAAAGLSSIEPVNGRYALYGVSGDMVIRVSGPGYRAHIQRVVVTDHTIIEIEIIPERPRVQISGDYTLTLTANPTTCGALPAEVRVRRYAAQVSQLGPEVWVTLANAGAPGGSLVRNQFGGRLDADNSRIVFNLALNTRFGYYDGGDTYYPPPDVAERMGGTAYLLISGGAVTSVSERSLSGTLLGLIQIVEMPSLWKVTGWGEYCNASHELVLAR